MLRLFIIGCLSMLTGKVCSQYFDSKIYPQNYFRNPLGIPMQLSGNFGELRSNHFHMGLDLRTQQKENLPVYAAADGYIYRIKIEPFGYGRAIYIKHPNGYTTVYAHLNDFYDTLNNYIKAKQYREEKWEQDFLLQPGMFTVNKGQFIAWSGNTGGSGGPHLHFEVRDAKENSLNPLLFDMPVKDVLPPYIYGLFMYNRNLSTYLQKPQSIAIKGSKGFYNTQQPIVETGSNQISFGISTEDITNSSSFRFGIYSAELWMDSSMQCTFLLNDFSYNDTRYINACIDYPLKENGGPLVQHLSQLPGNRLPIFSSRAGNGILHLTDTFSHSIEIVVKDVAGNISMLPFYVRYNPALATTYPTTAATDVLVPNRINNTANYSIQKSFNTKSLYDTVYYQETIVLANNRLSNMHIPDSICSSIPVHQPYNVAVKATTVINDALLPKALLQLKDQHGTVTTKGEWQNGWLTGSFNRMGAIQIIIDTTPPVVEPVQWKDSSRFNNQKNLFLKVTDDAAGIAAFRATLDGQWLMFSRKSNYFIYNFDEHCSNGWHTLQVTAQDASGNTSHYEWAFLKEDPLPEKTKKPSASSKNNSKKHGTKRRR